MLRPGLAALDPREGAGHPTQQRHEHYVRTDPHQQTKGSALPQLDLGEVLGGNAVQQRKRNGEADQLKAPKRTHR